MTNDHPRYQRGVGSLEAFTVRDGRPIALTNDRPLVFTTTITVAELLYGIERLPSGQRRDGLAALLRLFRQQLQDRILSFDEHAANMYPKIIIGRERMGRSIAPLDPMIASIARSRRIAVATRNSVDFENCAVKVIDPWN